MWLQAIIHLREQTIRSIQLTSFQVVSSFWHTLLRVWPLILSCRILWKIIHLSLSDHAIKIRAAHIAWQFCCGCYWFECHRYDPHPHLAFQSISMAFIIIIIAIGAKIYGHYLLVLLLLPFFQLKFVCCAVQDCQSQCLCIWNVSPLVTKLTLFLHFFLDFLCFFFTAIMFETNFPHKFLFCFDLFCSFVYKANYKIASCMYVIVYFVYIFKFVGLLIFPKFHLSRLAFLLNNFTLLRWSN